MLITNNNNDNKDQQQQQINFNNIIESLQKDQDQQQQDQRIKSLELNYNLLREISRRIYRNEIDQDQNKLISILQLLVKELEKQKPIIEASTTPAKTNHQKDQDQQHQQNAKLLLSLSLLIIITIEMYRHLVSTSSTSSSTLSDQWDGVKSELVKRIKLIYQMVSLNSDTILRLVVGFNLKLALAYMENWEHFVSYDFAALESDIRDYCRPDDGDDKNEIDDRKENWYIYVFAINKLVLLSEKSLDYNVIIPTSDNEIKGMGHCYSKPVSAINTIKKNESLIGLCMEHGEELSLALAQAIVCLILERSQNDQPYDPRAFTILIDLYRSFDRTLSGSLISSSIHQSKPELERLLEELQHLNIYHQSQLYIRTIPALYTNLIQLLFEHTNRHIMPFTNCPTDEDGSTTAMEMLYAKLFETTSQQYSEAFDTRLIKLQEILGDLETIRNRNMYRGGNNDQDDEDEDNNDDDDEDDAFDQVTKSLDELAMEESKKHMDLLQLAEILNVEVDELSDLRSIATELYPKVADIVNSLDILSEAFINNQNISI